MDPTAPPQHMLDIPMENQIQFGLAWDFFEGMDPVDLDAQVLSNKQDISKDMKHVILSKLI